jgi:hypothetical protein
VYNGHGLVDVALGSNYAEDLDLNTHLQSLDVDDVGSPKWKRSHEGGDRRLKLLRSVTILGTAEMLVTV